MKKLLTILFFSQIFWVSGQVGIHTDTPDNSSALEISATNRGLLIPRVTLTSSLSSPSPVTAPAVGLLVFNSGPNQPVGFYYWNGTTWVAVSGSGSGGGSDWTLTGNAGTIPGTNFLGTTDNNHFLVYTNNTERIRVENDGQVIIGGTAPNNSTDRFTVFGSATQTAAINAYSPRTGFQTVGGRYGILSTVDTANGFAYYGRNLDPLGYGMVTVGSNYTTVGLMPAPWTAGLHAQGYDGLHAKAKSTYGYGIMSHDSLSNTLWYLANVTAGVLASGSYGIISRGISAAGRGIVAIGGGVAAPSTSLESEAGAFSGFHGVYCKGNGYQTVPIQIAGIGVIGVGYGYATYSAPSGGLSTGGAFSGDIGVYAKGLNATGTGSIGVGNNGILYYTISNGSGGAFTGYHGVLGVGTNSVIGTGVIGGGNNGSYIILPSGSGGSFTGTTVGAAGFGNTAASGIGVIGVGNAAAAWVPSNGCGGAFTGNYGVFCRSIASSGTGILAAGNNIANPQAYGTGSGGAFTGNDAGVVGWGATAATGTGVIGAGNAISTPTTYASGSGGAFTGTAAGAVAYGTTAATGIGVIGSGNNAPISVPSTGCGGAFTGTVCGAYGYATGNGNGTYGGYFSNGGGTSYAYVGYRVSNANRKIVGNGTASSIVKNTKGEIVIMVCPEAPESLFQDFGIGQLSNGFAHITIDPDLAINLNVSEQKPLKVYITPEGDCNGVYVTNKSANGFDVIELQGGNSNVTFSWQIVATRANEEYVDKDGTKVVSDYSQRFDPAPGPLESNIIPGSGNQTVIPELKELKTEKIEKDSFNTSNNFNSQTLEVKQDEVIIQNDSLND